MWARDAVGLLSFAATPVFALMALVTTISGLEPRGGLCGVRYGTSLFAGMAPMYLLMSIFHFAPWLRLIATGNMRGANRMPAGSQGLR
jgi:hypothetical protein